MATTPLWVLKGPRRGSEAGSANIFRLVKFVWTEEAELAPLELEAGVQFGPAVAIDDDYVLAAAANDDDGGQDAGAVYVFQDDGNSWQQVAKLTSRSSAAEARFEWDVGIAGKNFIAAQFGAPTLAAIFAR